MQIDDSKKFHNGKKREKYILATMLSTIFELLKTLKNFKNRQKARNKQVCNLAAKNPPGAMGCMMLHLVEGEGFEGQFIYFEN
jgi:hypothetical protein